MVLLTIEVCDKLLHIGHDLSISSRDPISDETESDCPLLYDGEANIPSSWNISRNSNSVSECRSQQREELDQIRSICRSNNVVSSSLFPDELPIEAD